MVNETVSPSVYNLGNGGGPFTPYTLVLLEASLHITNPSFLLLNTHMLPRSSSLMALATFLIICVILLRRRFHVTPSFYRDVSGRGGPLSTWLNNEEARYAEVMQGRQQFITKWGPTAAEVES